MQCVNSEKQTHGEWFHLLDSLDEEMILGAQFCKEQGFTSFHTRFNPWGTHLANKFTLELHKRGVHSMKPVTNQESVDIVDDNDKAPFESGEDATATRSATSRESGRTNHVTESLRTAKRFSSMRKHAQSKPHRKRY